MQIPVQLQGVDVEPGLEWLDALGDPSEVAHRLSKLGITPCFPLSLWLRELILETFDERRVLQMTSRDLRRALLERSKGQIAENLLTTWRLEILLLRVGAMPNRRWLGGKRVSVYERTAFVRILRLHGARAAAGPARSSSRSAIAS